MKSWPGGTVLRILRRILMTVGVTLTVIFVGVNWIAPIALSFYATRHAPAIARIVPTDLKDQSVADSTGTKLSYLGYGFEVPWNDLDETQTKLYPKDKPEKVRVDLHFRSGLRVVATAIPAHGWTSEFAKTLKVPPERIEATFGKSDYGFANTLYEFNPDHMHHWSMSHRVHDREEFLLLIKSMVLSRAAYSGILRVQNQKYRGFQQGDPAVRKDEIKDQLFSDEGSIEMVFLQKDYKSSTGITQPEINRIVQTLRKTVPDSSSAPQIAAK